MKILTYARGEEQRAGILLHDTVYDIETCSDFFRLGAIPSNLLSLLASGKAHLLEELHHTLLELRDRGGDLPLRCWAALEEIRVCAPIARPPKLICLGRNYREHAEEQGREVPDRPLLFAKAPTAVIGANQPIVIPKGASKVDYEGELAFVMGKRLRKADAAEAAAAIFGFCCINDVTDREIQFKEKQWFRSKSLDTFAPLGPWIVTTNEIGDPLDLAITTKVNSQVMQSDSTRNLIFTPADIISFVTETITLEPGDIISTGTPGGVGVFREPQVFLKDGDTVEVTIDRIGTLSNPVIEES